MRGFRMIVIAIAITAGLLMTAGEISAASENSYNWGYTLYNTGESGSMEGKLIAQDASGNVYIAGNFSGTVNFNPSGGSDSVTTTDYDNYYFSKYDNTGQYLWTKTVSGAKVRAITVSPDGYLFITGEVKMGGTTDLDPSSGVDNHTSPSYSAIFVCKFDLDATYKWGRSFGGNDYWDYSHGIAAYTDGSVYIAGEFYGTVDFDPGTGTASLSSNGGDDVFLLKLDKDGNYLWAVNWGSTGSWDVGEGVAVDTTGAAYVVGHLYDLEVDMDPGSGTDKQTPPTRGSSFVSKFDKSGAYQWGKIFAGGVLISGDWDTAYGVTTDTSNNVYVFGIFSTTADFDPSGAVDNRTAVGYANAYLTKFDSSGVYKWTKTPEGDGTRRYKAVSIDGTGNIYAAGIFSKTVDFDPSTGTDSITSVEYVDYSMSQRAKSVDFFLSKFDSTGAYLWTETAGSEGSDNLLGMVVDSTGNAYLTGVIYPVLSQYALTTDKTDLNPGDATNLFTTNGNTAFLAKWGTEATVVEDFFTPVFSLNQSVFVTGERHLLTLSMTASYPQPVDVYVGVQIPGGQIYCLDSNLQLTTSLSPWKVNWTVTTIPQTTLLDMNLQGIPSGQYTWYLVIVKSGDSVLDTTKWIKQTNLTLHYTAQ